MTVKECYDSLEADFSDMMNRLGSEETVRYFAVKFLSDGSFSDLRAALAAGDMKRAFLAAHTLKGVAQNLGFTRLGAAASDMTEALRPLRAEPEGDARRKDTPVAAFRRVENEYARVAAAIRQIK